MRQLVTQGIILGRTDYGEADRILTIFTPDYGKLRLLAKGVRRVKSKLAGGIELFSVSELTFIKGRGEIGTLISTRLVKHYGHIVEDLNRTMMGYELIKQFHTITEDEAEAAYFQLLEQLFEGLDDADIPLPLIRMWFGAQLLRVGGRTPNLYTEVSGAQLDAAYTYEFYFDAMAFMRAPKEEGRFTAETIKFLRLLFSEHRPHTLAQVQRNDALTAVCAPLIDTLVRLQIA